MNMKKVLRFTLYFTFLQMESFFRKIFSRINEKFIFLNLLFFL